MGVVRLVVTSHMVVEVESCVKKEWDYQRLEGRKEDYKGLYELKGKLYFSKGVEFNNHIKERRKRERLQNVTIIVDKDVSSYEMVIVQEVIQYGNDLVGVVIPSEPKRVDGKEGTTLFTGLVLEKQRVHLGDEPLEFTLALVDIDGKGKYRECGVYKGLNVVNGEQILARDEVHQGSVVRFSVKDEDMEYYEKDEKLIFDEVFIINRYS